MKIKNGELLTHEPNYSNLFLHHKVSWLLHRGSAQRVSY